MNKLDGKTLSYARAHGTIKVPNAPQIGPELSETGNGLTRAVKMTVEGDCVVVQVLKHGTMPKDELIYVPLTNFSHFTVKAEPAIAKDNKAKPAN